MPVVVSKFARRIRPALLALPILAIVITGALYEPPPLYDESCRSTVDSLVVCAASEMARIPKSGRSTLEHPRFNLGIPNHETLRWTVARNESIAFQLILRRADDEAPTDLDFNIKQGPVRTVRSGQRSDGLYSSAQGIDGLQPAALYSSASHSACLHTNDQHSDELYPEVVNAQITKDSPGEPPPSNPFHASSKSNGTIQTTTYLAHYHHIKNGAYSWGPKTAVLPFPADYPDALIPQTQQCGEARPALFNTVTLPPPGQNQSLWVEMYVPDGTPPGLHTLTIQLLPAMTDSSSNQTTLTVKLDVLEATLPHKPTIDAIGEVYRAYNLEGVGDNRTSPEWKTMAQCYQTLAHQHRMVFIERTPDAPGNDDDWQHYKDAFGPSLTGELFSDQFNYTGTGKDTAVTVWRTPWPQQYDVNVTSALTAQELATITSMTADWHHQVKQNQWAAPSYFAYLFDEVDGPSNLPENKQTRKDYISRVHNDMQRIQKSIDDAYPVNDNAYRGPIDLLWTSHSDPTVWLNNENTTLIDKVRLWAPNAHAANNAFLEQRIDAGERAWFYHSGHPAVGGHSINLPGSDLRSWGVIGARYGIQGQLMWAVNLGSDDRPFAEPSYKPDDDRIGNGVLVYPGNQLPRIGYNAAPGPIPSMRLKAWRRGLQDAELYYLAHQRFPDEAEQLIKQLIPRALNDAVRHGDSQASWPRDSASWIDWRDDLLGLISR